MSTTEFYTIPKLTAELREFTRFYKIENISVSPDRFPVITGDRRCRFCSRTASDTTFNNRAHTIPQFLGNKFHVSDWECDKCNHKYGKNDEHLQRFLGILPTLAKTKGSKRIPDFKPSKLDLKVFKSTRSMINGGIEIEKSDFNNDAITYDPETGRHSFHYNKKAYVPFNVYKSLLKIALTCIPEREVKNYAEAFRILDARDSGTYRKIAKVHKTMLSFNDRKQAPHGFLFKKYNPLLKMGTHCFALYYQNVVLQFVIPYRRNDAFVYRSAMMRQPFCPPLYKDEPTENRRFTIENLDLSSTEEKCDDQEQWNLEMDDHTPPSTTLNLDTGEWTKEVTRPMANIVGVIMMPQEQWIPLDPTKEKKP